MITQYETWNGYAVHGDVKELDAIVESTGSVSYTHLTLPTKA